MADWLREILYPAVLFTAVASLWAYAYAESLYADLESDNLPPTQPGLIDASRHAGNVVDQADAVASVPVDR